MTLTLEDTQKIMADFSAAQIKSRAGIALICYLRGVLQSPSDMPSCDDAYCRSGDAWSAKHGGGACPDMHVFRYRAEDGACDSILYMWGEVSRTCSHIDISI